MYLNEGWLIGRIKSDFFKIIFLYIFTRQTERVIMIEQEPILGTRFDSLIYHVYLCW